MDAAAQFAGAAADSPRVAAERTRLEGAFGQSIQQRRPDVMRVAPAARPVDGDAGLPQHLKTGIESLSGVSMEGVAVQYNSSAPARLGASAFAQGRNIHLGPGQERHLPHEAWHVVQQSRGRVRPTVQLSGGVPVNDDEALEREADVMGRRAAALKLPEERAGVPAIAQKAAMPSRPVAQGMFIGPESVPVPWPRILELVTTLLGPRAVRPVGPTRTPTYAEKLTGTSAAVAAVTPASSAAETGSPKGGPDLQPLRDLPAPQLQTLIRKLAEWPHILYSSERDLLDQIARLYASRGSQLLAAKDPRGWRKLNRIAGQMQGKWGIASATVGSPPPQLLALEKVVQPFFSNPCEKFGRDVLNAGSWLVLWMEELLQSRGARFMWPLFDFMGHFGPLAFVLHGAESPEFAFWQGHLRAIRQLMAANPDGPTIVAHRGTGPTNRTMGHVISQTDQRRTKRRAENSPEAFQEALNWATGPTPLDGVECDVFLSADGVPVLSHEGNVIEQLLETQQKIHRERLREVRGTGHGRELQIHDLTAETLLNITRTPSKDSRFMLLTELLNMTVEPAIEYYRQTGKAFRVEVEMKGAKAPGKARPLQDAAAKTISRFYKLHPSGLPIEIVLFNGSLDDVQGYAALRQRKTALGSLYTGLGPDTDLMARLKSAEFSNLAAALRPVLDELRYQFTSEFTPDTVTGSRLETANRFLEHFIVTLVFGQEFAPLDLDLRAVEPSNDVRASSARGASMWITKQRAFDMNIQAALERYASDPANLARLAKLHVLTDYPQKAAWMKTRIKEKMPRPGGEGAAK